MLVYTGMIEQLQQLFKPKKPVHIEPIKKEGTSSGASTDINFSRDKLNLR
jgi:E3 ubiquitin-protein ligase UBR4